MGSRWRTAGATRWRWVRTEDGPRVEVEGQALATLDELRDARPALYVAAMGGAIVPGFGYDSVAS